MIKKYITIFKKHPIVGVLFLYFLVTLFKLNEIPGEWFGDIDILHEYVANILNGGWPLTFSLSAGPFYHYLIAPIVILIGQNYIHYKIASVLIGALGILMVYFMSREVAGCKVAILTAIISSVSFWTVVFARDGNSHIAIPFLVASTIYFSFKYLNGGRRSALVFAALFSSIGLFTYPQTFILPILLLIGLAFRKKYRIIPLAMLGLLPSMLLFLRIYSLQKDNFTNGYVGTKVPKIEQFFQLDTYKEMGIRIVRTLGMFHFRGDEGFRTNVSNTPHIDVLSGIFLPIGFYYWYKKDRKTLMLFIVSFLVIIIPSCSPSILLRETPNNGRTLGATPLVYLFIASGIFLFYEKIRKRRIRNIYIFSIVLAIACLNLYKYFVLYPANLPNKNVAFGKIISDYIDSLPSDTKIKLTSCCWGEWGQPEPKAIYYDLKNRNGRENIILDNPFVTTCRGLKKEKNTVYIFNPNDVILVSEFIECFPDGQLKRVEERGQKVFALIRVN